MIKLHSVQGDNDRLTLFDAMFLIQSVMSTLSQGFQEDSLVNSSGDWLILQLPTAQADSRNSNGKT